MRGAARAELREAAEQAGIRIHQFVHEPLAALYGYLRGHGEGDPAARVAELERKLVLVFDWGGGTLDLTLCQILRGALVQVFNTGDEEIGGDQFDDRLRHLVLAKHEEQYPGTPMRQMQPGAKARLIQACEDAKIALSTRDKTTMIVPDLLAVPGPAEHLKLELTRTELEEQVADLIRLGFEKIDKVLSHTGQTKGLIEFCLATGGMTSMPAIQEGLRELFGVARLRLPDNAPTLIADGTAWVAFDRVGLVMAKPLEILVADDSYVEIIPANTPLPIHGANILKKSIDLWSVDPSDGFAKFLIARPKWPEKTAQTDDRVPYTHIALPVTPGVRPLLERLRLDLQVDRDLIVIASATSSMIRDGDERVSEIHDLEFGLSIGEAIKNEGRPSPRG